MSKDDEALCRVCGRTDRPPIAFQGLPAPNPNRLVTNQPQFVPTYTVFKSICIDCAERTLVFLAKMAAAAELAEDAKKDSSQQPPAGLDLGRIAAQAAGVNLDSNKKKDPDHGA